MDGVYTVAGIHDGVPLGGVADYNGKPHVYERLFDEKQDDWSDQYLLKEIDAGLLALALEHHAIFLRWRRAFDEGKADFQTFPALPLDSTRYQELAEIIGDQLHVPPETSRKASGRFHLVSSRFSGTVVWT
jgi:hypothetical protein